MVETMIDPALNKAWKDACRILFGQEIGELADYGDWLAEMVDAPMAKKSSISGKDVVHSRTEYSEKSRSISLDEIDVSKRFEPLNINEIKDIDSIIEAISDRIFYTGNIVLGNSKEIQKSSNINDSFYAYNTTLSGNSKYMAFCTLARMDTYGFGGNAFSQCDFCVKCHELTRVKRSFELWMSQDCSDCYYSHGLKNSTNCFFSFNLDNARYSIGNLALLPDKYKELKTKLISEMMEELKGKKRLPSLPEIVNECKDGISLPGGNSKPSAAQTVDNKKINEEFAKTYEIIFKKKPARKIDEYSPWLSRHVRGFERCKSAASEREVFLAKYGNYCDLPKNRLLTLDEAKWIGQMLKLTAEEANDIDFKNASKKIGKIAFFNTDIQDGQNANNLECTILIDAFNCYRSVCTVYSKFCAYSFWPRSSQHIFGGDTVFDSGFCINSYNSVNLQRCMEMDGCNTCSDSYFCHNCENLTNSMFCFNIKNKRYAIGNAEVGMDNYAKIKSGILEQLCQELEKSGTTKYDIFGLGT